MSDSLKILGWIAVSVWLGLPSGVAAVELPGPLVEPSWLAKNLKSVVILDVREEDRDFFSKGHIPGAVLLESRKLQVTRKENGLTLSGMAPTASTFETLMREHGVNRDSAVVISSGGNTQLDATEMARLYWTLVYFGHDNVAILNGGTAAWARERRPLSFKTASIRSGDFVANHPQTAIIATTREVKSALQDRQVQIVDARSLGFYLGVYKVSYVNGFGHIPGAKLYPYDLAITKNPARFRSKSELKKLARAFHIDLARPLIVYCNTGVLSAGDWFIFHELIGDTRTRLYDGSMHAWTKTGQNPVETMKINLD